MTVNYTKFAINPVIVKNVALSPSDTSLFSWPIYVGSVCPADVYVKLSSDTNWTLFTSTLAPIQLGTLNENVPAPANVWETDYTNTINVSMIFGEPKSAGASNAYMNGNNFALIGDIDSWELVYFQNVTQHNDTKEFVLDTLLRGRNGSDATSCAHKVGEYVIVGNSGLRLNSLPAMYGNRYVDFCFTQPGQPPDAGTKLTYVGINNIIKAPWAPVNANAVRNSNGIKLSWTRRDPSTRGLQSSVPSIEPLSFFPESYRIDLYTEDSLLTSLSANTTSLLMSNDMLSEYGLSNANMLICRIRQLASDGSNGAPWEGVVYVQQS